MSQELTWERSGQSHERYRRYLVRALLRSGVCVILEDGRSEYLFIANLLDAWHLPEGEMPTDLILFGPTLAAQIGALKAQARRTGENGRIEIELDSDRHFEIIVEPMASLQNEVDLMTTIIEVSEERRREAALRDLLREVNHRSKNLLAIIQSIASQTSRHSDSIEQFVQKFRGRLYSLSLSQDLITNSLWRGASFHDLVAEQLRRYLPEAAGQVDIRGGDIIFSPNAALHIGLALHELIINAVTHGSFSAPDAGVLVSCTETREGDRDMINFEWRENRLADAATDNEVSRNVTPHFGCSVLERVLPASVSGKASYEIDRGKVVYRLDFPADINKQ